MLEFGVRDIASIVGGDSGERRKPVELVVQASPNDIGRRLFTDVDPHNTQNGLIKCSGCPKIDVEILRLHSQSLGVVHPPAHLRT
jgi:hypothetical protein